jgi:serpin B
MTRSFIRLIALAALTSSAACAPAVAAPQGIRLAQNESAPAQDSANTAAPASEAATDRCGAPHPFEKWDISAEMLKSNAAFTLDVLTHLSQKDANATISPFGLSSVLSTLYLGASDPMRAAIVNTLHVKPDKLDELRRAARLLELASQRDPHRFASYNAIFVDHHLQLKPGVAELAKTDSDIDLRAVDFSSQADIDAINDLLAKKTDGRIKSILDPGSSPLLVAANAFAFKNCWKAPFDPTKTASKAFTRVDKSKADRPMMSVTSNAILYGETKTDSKNVKSDVKTDSKAKADGKADIKTVSKTDGKTDGKNKKPDFVAVELPYLDEDFALTIVTTREDPARLADFKQAEAEAMLSGIGLADANVTLSLPKFGGTADNELLNVLSGMGLGPALTSDDQLPKFAEKLKLGRVRQKTWLAVDEKGTEAAAVTTAEISRSAQPPRAVTATFDKPFVFALRHRPTGAILMAGYVGDPGEEQAAKKD